MQPELNARSLSLEKALLGVSCRYTEWEFGNMNFTRPSAFVGPAGWRSM